MTKTPARSANVFFLGAGVSSAFGLPNTPELLGKVHDLCAENSYWGKTKGLEHLLQTAYKYFYPVEIDVDAGFRPNVVDFFSVLRTFSDIGKGLPGVFSGAGDLLTDLRRALAHVLINAMRDADASIANGHTELDRIVAPGNLIITSNWDLLIERYASAHGIPLRHTAKDWQDEVTLLKLHGSVDWCAWSRASKNIATAEYSTLRERQFGPRPHQIKPTKARDSILRIRALENWSSAWSRIKSRATEPLMVTMSMGKVPDLSELGGVWRDAFSAVSRAQRLEVIGYSLPLDDLEVRTLLNAGLKRGQDDAEVVVRNPSPDVHDRFRRTLSRHVKSDYTPLPPP